MTLRSLHETCGEKENSDELCYVRSQLKTIQSVIFCISLVSKGQHFFQICHVGKLWHSHNVQYQIYGAESLQPGKVYVWKYVYFVLAFPRPRILLFLLFC